MSSDPTTDRDDQHVDRADRVAEKLAIPVLIAALASVPGVFLTLFDDPWETVGSGLNTMSGAVLVGEAVVLLALAEDKRAWLKRNWWLVALAAVIIPAVIFAVGPVQLLRLVRVVGALRIIRVRRIFKAGKIVRERAGLDEKWQRAMGFGITALCAAFVGIVLADPTSTSRQFVESAFGELGWIAPVLAGLLLAGATFVVARQRRGGRDADGQDQSESGTESS